jgi:DNA repair ATPase RecN
MERLNSLGYKSYSKNGLITIYKDGYDKIPIEKVFGSNYSKNKINERLYYSRQRIFKPMSHKSIFDEYSKTNKKHKGIYGLYLYYCYLLDVFPKKYPKQYLPYSIRQEIKKLDEYSEQVRFMANNKIETEEDLKIFSDNNYNEYRNLMGIRENLWRKYNRTKDEDKKTEILSEINTIQPKIKELRKYDNYCKKINERTGMITNNLNNFDKDMQKEKDNYKLMMA